MINLAGTQPVVFKPGAEEQSKCRGPFNIITLIPFFYKDKFVSFRKEEKGFFSGDVFSSKH